MLTSFINDVFPLASMAASTLPATTLAASAIAIAMGIALVLDRLWGEPPTWLHPVVGMGRVLGWWGQRLAPRQATSPDYQSFWLLALVWCALAAIIFIIFALLQWALLRHLPGWAAALGVGLLLKPLLAWRMLRDEVLAVEAALTQSLPAGRQRLAWLVSRETADLDAVAVREAAIETLAENLNDSVIAPLLWFALLGLPGAALYRFANTADAMWGYPGWRGQGQRRRYWQWAGKWAARADDVLSWLPARLTALLLAAVAGGLPWQLLRQCARATPSPNGGWSMGAMALAVDVRLGKPGVYQLHPSGQAAGPVQLAQAVKYAEKVALALMGLALAAMIFFI